MTADNPSAVNEPGFWQGLYDRREDGWELGRPAPPLADHLARTPPPRGKVAVLGCGLDVTYPPENRKLVGRVLERGALISQFPMGTPALPGHFPLRNRTIAGLALGTIVVEAAAAKTSQA